MSRYRKSSHAVYQIHIHFVFITKYRKPVLKGEIGIRLRELIREICRGCDIEILKGHVRPDHVHILLSLPPQLSVSKAMQVLKGKSSYKLLREYRQLGKEFWGRHLWGRGYFANSSGNVTGEVLKKYIELQDVEGVDDDFKVTD